MGQKEHERTSRPDPDPTTLTTQALYREIANAKELLQNQIKAFFDDLTTRLDGMEKLYDQKFESIKEQFAQRDDNLKTTLQSNEKSVAEVKEGLRRDIESLRTSVDSLRSFQQKSGLDSSSSG